MVLELLFNGALLVFFIYCYFYIAATTPEAAPGRMASSQWPQMIIVLLAIFLIVNIINIIRNKEKEGTKININIKGILGNKLFLGIVIVLLYTFSLDYIGFIFGSFLFFLAYSRLLGQKKTSTLLLSSAIAVVVFYVLFNVGLNIMLPRGTGIFREFALFIESL